MRRLLPTITVAVGLWLWSLGAHALGFGGTVNNTQLGMPLNFAATVRLSGEDSLPRECVVVEVFSGDNRLQPGQLRVTVEPGPDPAERRVRVTSSTLIDEPVVTVNVTVGCLSKVSRRFVSFIDPPGINLAQSSTDTETLAPQAKADSQLAPLVAIAQAASQPAATPGVARPSRGEARARAAGRASERPVVVARAPARRPAAVAVAAAAQAPGKEARRQPRPRVVVAKAGPARAASGAGSRLQLEAAPMIVAQAAAASAPGAMADVAAATLAASAAESRLAEQTALLEQERQRLQRLEDSMNRLRAETESTQRGLTDLSARLKSAEAERYSNPLVYALMALAALLAAAVGVLWWRQSRPRDAAQWWAAPVPPDAAPREPAVEVFGAASAASAAMALAPLVPLRSLDDDEAPATHAPRTVPVPVAELHFDEPMAATTAPMRGPRPPAPEPDRELSVEELIDLEQQAEFFIVLGQDEAAIDLLMSHVRSNGGTSPLPYLKLLEIYRRRGDHDDYARIRDRFNRRFNAYAPNWDDNLDAGRALEDYPEILTRLQGLWVMPSRVMKSIDTLLFKRNSADNTFDLPAYRELLFLYSVARDLSENDASEARDGAMAGGVDLLLPLDDGDSGHISLFMTASMPGDLGRGDMATRPVDLDISLAPPAEAHTTVAHAKPAGNVIDFNLDSGFLNLDEPAAAVKPRGFNVR